MKMIPEWIPADAWAGYVEMRKKIRKPMTDRAISLAVNTLTKLREEGYEPGAVLDQSVMNSWQGLFPIQEDRRTQRAQSVKLSPLSKTGQATANNLLAWLEEA